MKQYVLVNEDGFLEDVVLLNDDEVTEFHVPPNTDRLFNPKWDFEKLEWTEGLSPEQVIERENEITRQQAEHQLNSIENLLARTKAAEDLLLQLLLERMF